MPLPAFLPAMKPFARRALALLVACLHAAPGQALTTVGNGTPESCDSTGVRKAVAAGGDVRFSCGPAPVAIDFVRCTTVTGKLSLDGAGLVTLRRADSCGNAEFFVVAPGGSLTLTGLTLAGGTTTAVHNDGTVVIASSLLIGNGGPAAVGNGGAIYNNGTLTVKDSAFVDNITPGRGGAVFANPAAKTTIVNVTFTGNRATSGGALFLAQGFVVNATLVGNIAASDGGAISNPRLDAPGVVLRNSLVVDNASGDATGNCTPAGLSDPPAAAVIDGGGNTQFPGIGCAASIPVLDPQLLPPGHFGSATVVAPVAAASPVRDAADVVSCPAGDQRGRARARIVDGRPACSPGAVEFDPADVSPVTTAIEYYYAARDHYFVTPLAAEIAALDTGYFPGWARTGHTIPVLVDTGQQVLHTVPVCRFYGRPEAGLDSHFFSATPAECAQVQSRFPAAWILETTSLFTMPLPDAATGACPAGTNPVYRLFNDRADVNHRYTLYPAVRSEMLAQRWIAEGAGADGVVWCAVRG